LLELSGLVKDKSVQVRYRKEALAMLDELSSPRYMKPAMNHAMLQHSTGNKPQGKDIDVPLIYADYYFVEALRRAGRL
jgi:unsaturated chondroitin disaccharide hydrolase